jgi:photosystem II stability/assembly factor-like uncharacterized protein
MRTICKALILWSALTLLTSVVLQALQAGRIESMKLLTADVGWAATKSHLFWTTDSGAHWKDITPKLNHKGQSVSSVFFLDASTGWALLNCGDDRDQRVDDVCFEFAPTNDSGQSWSIVHPKIVDPVANSSDIEDGLGFSGTTFLDFADSKHGWAILKKSHNVTASFGVTLRTIDGGRTWTQLAKGGMPVAEHFHFVTATDGWIAGGPDQELYVTHDAGDSWQKVQLGTPKNISTGFSPVYDLPTFLDDKLGILPVTYDSIMSSEAPLVLFKTEDNGRTWHPDVTLSALPNAPSWAPFPSAVVGGELVTATVSGGRLNLLRAGQGSPMRSQPAEAPVGVSSVAALSFVSPTYGWLLAGHRLLRTVDGGAAWSDVTPPGTASSMASPDEVPTKTTVRRDAATSPASGLPNSSATGSTASTHLGFDTFPTPPLPKCKRGRVPARTTMSASTSMALRTRAR